MFALRSIVAGLLLAALMAHGVGAQPDPAQPAQPVVVKVDGGGFHWEDAGLGAAAGVATTLLIFALVVAVRPSGQAAGGQDLATSPEREAS